jgi:hypothetical protein
MLLTYPTKIPITSFDSHGSSGIIAVLQKFFSQVSNHSNDAVNLFALSYL